jgi:squalene-hopene/tetraprenyl-beta-curcumene cyclase
MKQDTIFKKDIITADRGLAALDKAIAATRDYLLGIQNEKGYWVGELEADASVSAGYIPVMYAMTAHVDEQKQRKVINYVRSKQNPDGSWPTYYSGLGDISVTIQVYLALKLAGVSADEEFMRSARDFVLKNGGIMQANTITKIWLSVFGQFDWRGVPSIPPEIVLFPNWFFFNIYEFASWSRATIMALIMVIANKTVFHLPARAQVPELYVEPEGQRHFSTGKIEKLFSWRSFFLIMDRIFKAWERVPLKPFRKLALKKTEEWVVEHQEADGSWGGIMLPWVYSLFALKYIGYKPDHPVIKKGLDGLDGFIMEDEATLRMLPATSPVWDTAWSTVALSEAGVPAGHPALIKSAQWLMNEEIKCGGDWQIKNPQVKPGCWAFEFDNDLYPDMDDTSLVSRALLRVRLPGDAENEKIAAVYRGLNWVIGMQSDDDGWAAFDCNNNLEMLAHIPFGDFITPLDPTSADVTAHVVELLAELNHDGDCLQKALAYIRQKQYREGYWYGRWGVNYIYGTVQALLALRAAGEDMNQDYITRAADWLVSCQNPDGGWGECCITYEKPEFRGQGYTTASQTAWAVMGLMATGRAGSASVRKGIDYLLTNQLDDGTWEEKYYTGTGFPRAFYLKYGLYRIYFPLIALSQYRNSIKERKHE